MMNTFTKISTGKHLDLSVKGQNALFNAIKCFSVEVNLDKLLNAVTKKYNDRKKTRTLSR
jgi:hypothetical protein